MADNKEKSLLQESLIKLYLRLNGYFTTGFIVHSGAHGKNKTEIDVLAVRLRYYSEPERGILPSDFLPSKNDKTNLLLCEVKSKGQQLQFNDSIRSHPNTIGSILRWSGLFKEEEIVSLSESLVEAMKPAIQSKKSSMCIEGPRDIVISPLLCSPERNDKRDNQPYFLHGHEIFSYIWKCMRPTARREGCATCYDYTAWGREFSPIVKYFKSRPAEEGLCTMKELYKSLQV